MFMYRFFYGLFVGAGAMRLLTWDLDGKIAIPWYAWLIGIMTFLFATLTLQTFFASFQEREPKAAWMSLLVLGVPTLILAAITTVAVLGV
jgi:hypothetical protein